MVLAVEQIDRQGDDGEAEWAFSEIFLYAGFNSGDVISWNGSAVNGLVKLESGPAWQRFDLDMNVAEFAMAATLFLVACVLLDRFSNGLLVGYLRPFGLDGHIVAFLKLISCDLQLDVALTPEQLL